MYRWIMDPRVSAEPLKRNRSGMGQLWEDQCANWMLKPCYKAMVAHTQAVGVSHQQHLHTIPDDRP
jgi:hypothetical protein